jgi:hypothetical protein
MRFLTSFLQGKETQYKIFINKKALLIGFVAQLFLEIFFEKFPEG